MSTGLVIWLWTSCTSSWMGLPRMVRSWGDRGERYGCGSVAILDARSACLRWLWGVSYRLSSGKACIPVASVLSILQDTHIAVFSMQQCRRESPEEPERPDQPGGGYLDMLPIRPSFTKTPRPAALGPAAIGELTMGRQPTPEWRERLVK